MAEVASRPAVANTASRTASDTAAPPPPPPTAAPATKKGKGKKVAPDSEEARKQLQAKIAQLEQDRAGKSEEDAEIEREARKANREMQNIMQKMDSANDKAEHIQREWHKLLIDMKRTEREHTRAKKRADQLQKDKDAQRSELSKANSIKEKLEKLSRELTKDNKKLKEDLREAKETAADKNDELHHRLEQMVGDVEEVIQSREAPSRSATDLSGPDNTLVEHYKLRSLIEQYEMREIHMASVLRTRELEIQYHIAQHEKLRKAQDAELSKSHQLTRQVSTFSQTENELRSQLNIYVEKFKQVRQFVHTHSFKITKLTPRI
ncbi:myosin-like coiled-coil protein-domain-containing protein [Elsinoe ampelina]|uniref:Myosin-like coiled-coil protein-domain-containing protein n=1 Tax=Elsinoe ampelina TaxID=302913 RepID=A0A6A6G9U9_9PEZI|nr:myosin-like coiled-coil protein-domain-containing protein [Elsinoe ampelina]